VKSEKRKVQSEKVKGGDLKNLIEKAEQD